MGVGRIQGVAGMNPNFNTPTSTDDPRIGYFDALAEQWDHCEPLGGSPQGRLAAHRTLLGFRPGQDVLEVGCGTGMITAWLAEQVAPGRVTAVDFSPAMIAQARAKHIDADFECKDACRDDFGLARYDVVFCFHSFPHFRDQAAALQRLGRALKAGGRLLVMHLAGSTRINDFHAALEGPVRGDRLPQGLEWEPLLAAAGLTCSRLIDEEALFFLQAHKLPPASS